MQDDPITLYLLLTFVFGILVGRFLTLLRAGFRKKPGEARMHEFIERIDRMSNDHRTALRLVRCGDDSASSLLQRLGFELDELGAEASRVRAEIIKGV
jgi:hypothetical protein